MKRNFTFILIFGLLFSFLSVCGIENKSNEKLYIAISKGSGSEGYLMYAPWLKNIDTNICVVDLYVLDVKKAVDTLKYCSGLLLSGGPDVHPGRYGIAKDSVRCDYIDRRRDTLEFAIIKEAERLKMPILGICRGLQILNVYYGGSLIVDIPSDYKTKISHRSMDTNAIAMHKVNIDKESSLFKLTNLSEGVVNSYHHQAIKKLAKKLKITARAEDGIPEAIEWKNPHSKPFLMAVQWHPERLDYNHPLSKSLSEEFIKYVKKYQEKRK